MDRDVVNALHASINGELDAASLLNRLGAADSDRTLKALRRSEGPSSDSTHT